MYETFNEGLAQSQRSIHVDRLLPGHVTPTARHAQSCDLSVVLSADEQIKQQIFMTCIIFIFNETTHCLMK